MKKFLVILFAIFLASAMFSTKASSHSQAIFGPHVSNYVAPFLVTIFVSFLFGAVYALNPKKRSVCEVESFEEDLFHEFLQTVRHIAKPLSGIIFLSLITTTFVLIAIKDIPPSLFFLKIFFTSCASTACGALISNWFNVHQKHNYPMGKIVREGSETRTSTRR